MNPRTDVLICRHLLLALALGCLWPTASMAQSVSVWRKVESPNPRGGPPMPALMRVGDIDRSDAGFVGMMVRCREKVLQTVLVVIQPLPPGQSSVVTLRAGGSAMDATGTPIVTGAGIAVPVDLVSRLDTVWRGEPDLDITIKTPTPLHGTVPLAGLHSLIGAFDSDCRAGSPTDATPPLR